MIKDEKVIERLAGLAKIEPKVLSEALNAAEEKTVEIPEGIQSFKADELNTYTSNAINEAKPNIQKAAVEVAFKELGREHGFDETVRDGKAFVNHFKMKVLTDAKLEPNKIEEKYQSQLKEKDDLLKQKDSEIGQLKTGFEDFKLNTSIDSKILSSLGESKLLPKDDRIILFKTKYEVKKTGDITEVFDKSTGQPMKDSLKNPMKIEDVVKEFDKKYITESGRGGGGGQESTPIPPNKIKETLLAKGLKEGSVEYYTEYNKMLNQK